MWGAQRPIIDPPSLSLLIYSFSLFLSFTFSPFTLLFSVSLFLSVFPFICPSVRLSLYLIPLVSHLPLSPSLSLFLSLSLSILLSIYPPLTHSLSLSPSFSHLPPPPPLSLFLPPSPSLLPSLSV